jgi:hypothetical protein
MFELPKLTNSKLIATAPVDKMEYDRVRHGIVTWRRHKLWLALPLSVSGRG